MIKRPISKWSIVAWSISASLAINAFIQVSRTITSPYIDEIFHFPQTVRYCQGLWTEWDPKITTPPGLYILGFIYSKIVSNIVPYSYNFCSLNQLRSMNLLAVTLIIPVLCHLLAVDYTVAFMPLIAFYSTLYYTDVWSTLFILLSFVFAKRNLVVLSALSGAISLWFRQTNIVWIGLIGLSMVDDITIIKTLKNLYKRPLVTVCFGVLAISFCAFIKFNHGITLGDKSNHQMSTNIPQLFHFMLFYLFFSWPLWLSRQHIGSYLRNVFGKPIQTSIGLGLIALITYKFTKPHPFILADNRHYTFYLWKRIIDPSWNSLAKLIPVPVYHFGLWTFLRTLRQSSTSDIFQIGFLISIMATLIPSPLLEPRYYIIPYIFWRIFYNPSSIYRRQLEWIWYMVINIVTYWIFLNKPFIGPDGQISRFMW